MRPIKKCRVSFEELLDLHEGRANAAAAEGLRAHLASDCKSCQARMAEIGRIESLMRQGELTPAPEHVVERARELFRERFVRPARQSLIAQIVFDSRSRLALSGARGAETGQIQALYSTGEHDIDLWQEKASDGHWYVIGQVLPKGGGPPVTVAGAALTDNGGKQIHATNEGAEFHLAAVRAGQYTLQIDLPDAEITVPDVTVGI